MFQFISKVQEQKRRRTRNKVIFFSLFTGILSSLVTLFFAPKSGKETRAEVAEKSKQFSNKASEYLKQTGEEVGNKVQDLKEKATEVAQNLKTRFNQNKNTVIDKVEDKAEDFRGQNL